MQKSAGSPRFSDSKKPEEGQIAEHCRQRDEAAGGIQHHVETGVVSIRAPPCGGAAKAYGGLRGVVLPQILEG
jgi:hypothetical protein